MKRFGPPLAPAVERRMAVERIKRDLGELEKAGSLLLSHDSISSAYDYPRFISLAQPPGPDTGRANAEAAEKGASTGRGGKKKFDEAGEIKRRALLFSDLFRREIGSVDVPAGWKSVFTRMIWQHTASVPPMHACIEMLQGGMVFEKNRQRLAPVARPKPGETPGETPVLQQQLREEIGGIIAASEEKNGSLPSGRRTAKRKMQAAPEDEAVERVSDQALDRFMFYLERDRNEIAPPTLWQRALGSFLEEVLAGETAFQACVVAFKIGIIWRRNHRQLENA
jgi:hypothetical protein